MADFELSPEELATICRRMAAANAAIPERVDQIRAGDVGTGDFGGSRHTGVARRYLHLFTEVLPGLLGGYASASATMSDRLTGVLGAYQSADERGAEALESISVGRRDVR